MVRYFMLIGMLSLGGMVRADAPSVEEVFADVSASVVFIVTVSNSGGFYGQGSGVVIKPGTVVTNCHVLRGADDVGVLTRGEFYPAPKVIDSNLSRDLCLLQVPDLLAPSITLGSADSLRVGQKVLAIGAPHGLDLGLDLSLSEGLISSLRRAPDQRYPVIQTSAPISPGSSGGALLDSSGRLIGITTFGHASGQNINFAVPVDWIRDFAAAQ